MTVGTSLASSLEPLAHRRNVDITSLDITLVNVHLNWLSWFQFPILETSTRCSYRLHDRFSVTIPNYYKDVDVNFSSSYNLTLQFSAMLYFDL